MRQLLFWNQPPHLIPMLRDRGSHLFQSCHEQSRSDISIWTSPTSNLRGCAAHSYGSENIFFWGDIS